jgi:transposase
VRRHELTDEEWDRIAPLLPAERGRKARPAKLPNRTFMNAMFFVAKTGVPWRDLPERFGPWKTVYARFSRWNQVGVFERVLQAFTVEADREAAIADSTYIRAHQHAAGGKGGPSVSALDALAAVSLRRSTPSSTDWATPFISTSRPATSTTSPRRRGSSRKRAASISSPTAATTRAPSQRPSKPKA